MPWLIALVWLVVSTRSGGQEALNRTVAAERSAGQLRQQVDELPYTFRIKDLRISMTASAGLEWNDNIRLAHRQPQSDGIFSPNIGFHLFQPVGEANILTFDLGFGYSKYFVHSELDRLDVMPGSALSFDIKVGDFNFNLHDRLSYRLDPVLQGAVSGTGTYGGIDNSAGLVVSRGFGRVSSSVGYDYVRFISASSQFESLDRTSHQFLARVGAQLAPTFSLGVEASVTPSSYDQPSITLNDSLSYSGGVNARWQVSEAISLTPRVGYSLYTFSVNGAGFAPADSGSVYFGVVMDHQIASRFKYQLTADRSVNPGVAANLSELLRVGALSTWTPIRDTPLTLGYFNEHGRQTAGLEKEVFDRHGINFGVGYQLTQKGSLNLNYVLTLKSSDTPDRDYVQNRLTLTFGYRL